MKISVAAIPFFLLITIALGTKTESSSQTGGKPKVVKIQLKLVGGPYHPSECCFTYTTYKIPRQRIMDYYETNSQCSKPGIVFITKRGHSVCTNPSDKWVQDYIKDMKEN
ncbi:C-C motif chemokine 14 isoform 2 precursor [Homo sapiens]|uniref:Isoform HCC-3 of C-C motif chemokine 14 n=1 Tax=Homo sapiens TaxID=9606 RepID=Q16627-2|nr:C-C motif chemokine 14 isoform 2 precursor [Homo sapiens]AAF23982.1 small inducible cytokine A14 precursor [Homo sapiens]EAW80105.1 hCG2042867, isoform CRA_a [Homo sapiens]EAW80108.1 hCG2042867, isoform CRA_a [Homo sapiens]KAI2582464.1 C-C motif chemokine ligand 14 [Homo sapiens]CAA94309.1 chemokine CC-3 [Homo sapiens]|eukprot:NP_116738.1 C-C motif chemokine 14 isoform 2 precursor [Homo sapiens]